MPTTAQVWLPSTLKRERETEFSSTPQTTKSTRHLTRKTTAPTRAVTPMVAGSHQGMKMEVNQATTTTCFMPMASFIMARDGPESSASGPSWSSCSASA